MGDFARTTIELRERRAEIDGQSGPSGYRPGTERRLNDPRTGQLLEIGADGQISVVEDGKQSSQPTLKPRMKDNTNTGRDPRIPSHLNDMEAWQYARRNGLPLPERKAANISGLGYRDPSLKDPETEEVGGGFKPGFQTPEVSSG